MGILWHGAQSARNRSRETISGRVVLTTRRNVSPLDSGQAFPYCDRVTTNGEAVRAIRLAKGITAAKLAAAVGISPQYLSNIEHGRKPGACRAEALAEALDVRVEAITQGDNLP